jgi:hypothetical protein
MIMNIYFSLIIIIEELEEFTTLYSKMDLIFATI